jgi:rSAM/selenodomain-associated transferase 1
VTKARSPDCGLIIFLRLPEWGRVKTRLAETVGPDKALLIYKELSGITLRFASRLPVPVYLFYENGLPAENERIPYFHYMSQSEGNLGDKIIHALQYVRERHQKIIIIGSDCPDLMPSDIISSIDLLDHVDIVIGPSEDGGYYLLGCREIIPEIFESISWSTSAVLRETLAKVESKGLAFSLLRTLTDIDTEADWVRYQSQT